MSVEKQNEIAVNAGYLSEPLGERFTPAKVAERKKEANAYLALAGIYGFEVKERTTHDICSSIIKNYITQHYSKDVIQKCVKSVSTIASIMAKFLLSQFADFYSFEKNSYEKLQKALNKHWSEKTLENVKGVAIDGIVNMQNTQKFKNALTDIIKTNTGKVVSDNKCLNRLYDLYDVGSLEIVKVCYEKYIKQAKKKFAKSGLKDYLEDNKKKTLENDYDTEEDSNTIDEDFSTIDEEESITEED